MRRSSSSSGGQSPGSITVRCFGDVELRAPHRPGPGVPARHDQYEWTPPANLPMPLPDGGKITFNVYMAADQIRRFVPREQDGYRLFIARAFQNGHSLLARERSFDRGQWCEYLVAKLAFDRLGHVQERISRSFRSASSLTLSKLARTLVAQSDILPDDLGLFSSGSGQKWTVGEALKHGGERAKDDGIADPTVLEQISHGLLAAAERNPLEGLSADEVEPLVQMSLYDFSRAGLRTSAEQQQEVWDRFHELVQGHLLDHQENFQKWLAGGHSNLPKAIARMAGKNRLDGAVVRRGLLDIGWRGYRMAAECVEAFAKAFSRALIRPLSEKERSYFTAMYYRQPCYGGLVLPLILDRSQLIRPVVVQLWEEPENKQLAAVLHRMLWYYSDMATRSREANRLAKENALQVEKNHEREVPADKTAVESNPLLKQVLREILALRKIECPICHGYAYGELVEAQFVKGRPVKIQAACIDHDWSTTLDIPWDEVAGTSRRLAADEDR